MTHPSDTKKSTPAHAAADVCLDERENRFADNLFMDVFEERQRHAFQDTEKLPKPDTQPDDGEFFLDGEDIACLGMRRVDNPWDDMLRPTREKWDTYFKAQARINAKYERKRQSAKQREAIRLAKEARAAGIDVAITVNSCGAITLTPTTTNRVVAGSDADGARSHPECALR
jgi:hypothetical protein